MYLDSHVAEHISHSAGTVEHCLHLLAEFLGINVGLHADIAFRHLLGINSHFLKLLLNFAHHFLQHFDIDWHPHIREHLGHLLEEPVVEFVLVYSAHNTTTQPEVV